MRHGLYVAFVLLVAACAKPLGVDGSPCPCAPSWHCCGEQGCVPAGERCASQPCASLPTHGDGDKSCAAQGGIQCDDDRVCLTPALASADAEFCCPVDDCIALDGRLRTVAKPAASPPVLDGLLDDWTEIERTPMAKVAFGPTPTDTDFSARFATQWDATGIYVLVEATDQLLVPPDSTLTYHDDSIEVFVDMDSRHPQVDYNLQDLSEGQMFVAQTNAVNEISPNLRGWTAAAYFASSTGKWWFEFALTWPDGVFPDPEAGDLLGFDVAADDEDSPSTGGQDRENQLFWNDGTGHLNDDASHFGLIELLECNAP
jgi:hypothetical protein